MRDAAQPAERLTLELPAALLTDAEPLGDLGMALLARGAQAEAAHDDLAMARRQQAQHRIHLVAVLVFDHVLARIDRTVIGHQLEKWCAALANGLVERRGDLTG